MLMLNTKSGIVNRMKDSVWVLLHTRVLSILLVGVHIAEDTCRYLEIKMDVLYWLIYNVHST